MTRAICRAPSVKHFVVGVTATHGVRRGAYRRKGFPYFVVLAMGFTGDQATQIERVLFTTCVKNKFTYSKYAPKKRDKPYHKSLGGSKRYIKSHVYSIYMAWY